MNEKQGKGDRLFFWLVVESILVFSLAAAYLFWDSAAVSRFFAGEVRYASAPEGCSLNDGPCTASFPEGGTMELSASPRPLRPMVPLRFSLRMEGMDGEEASLVIYGINMDMGRFPVTLRKSGPGMFDGSGIVPTCVGAMTWQVEAIVPVAGERLGGRFRFTTE